jgi:hypothetical protein
VLVAKVGLAIEMDFVEEFTAAHAARLRFNNVLSPAAAAAAALAQLHAAANWCRQTKN